MFPALNIDKLGVGILDRPQIRRLIKNNAFVLHMTTAEYAAWNSCVVVVERFLGKSKQLA